MIESSGADRNLPDQRQQLDDVMAQVRASADACLARVQEAVGLAETLVERCREKG